MLQLLEIKQDVCPVNKKTINESQCFSCVYCNDAFNGIMSIVCTFPSIMPFSTKETKRSGHKTPALSSKRTK
ncbi:MAG TPA: hypothetical protein DEB31_10180 [Clostridiales bacterium]|nr:hypothetical protein [Clostridiales bacterium]